jgi:hypothetical protein
LIGWWTPKRFLAQQNFSETMSNPEPRLTWIQMAPASDDMHTAECGQYAFEISKALDPARGYLLQMWHTRPEDWPLVVWEMDGFSLPEAKGRAERLANQHVPVILQH